MISSALAGRVQCYRTVNEGTANSVTGGQHLDLVLNYEKDFSRWERAFLVEEMACTRHRGVKESAWKEKGEIVKGYI